MRKMGQKGLWPEGSNFPSPLSKRKLGEGGRLRGGMFLLSLELCHAPI